jgi:hypothetical protein
MQACQEKETAEERKKWAAMDKWAIFSFYYVFYVDY